MKMDKAKKVVRMTIENGSEQLHETANCKPKSNKSSRGRLRRRQWMMNSKRPK
jgi:hypothetical protein